jgi:hypothetical protein
MPMQILHEKDTDMDMNMDTAIDMDIPVMPKIYFKDLDVGYW